MAIYSLFGQGGKIERIDVPENSILNNLPIGTVLQWSGYGDHRIVIVKNCGISDSSFAGHGTTYECIDLVNYGRERHQSMGIRHISKKYGIGIYLIDVPLMSPDEIMDVLTKEKEANVRKAKELEIKETKRKEDFERLNNVYSYLSKVHPGGYASAKLGASNIRIELKKAFPKVKFSVRSSVFSGGDSINVDWIDGPTTEAVDKIIGKYQEGHFNGMEDIYERNTENQFPDIYGGAKYVNGQRGLTENAYNLVAKGLGYNQAVFNKSIGNYDGVDYQTGEMLKREAWKLAF